MELFPHLFRIHNIDNIIENVITDTFIDNLSSHSDGYAIILYF